MQIRVQHAAAEEEGVEELHGIGEDGGYPDGIGEDGGLG